MTMVEVIVGLKSDKSLLKKLENAKAPSKAEELRQKVSFVYGLLDEKACVTREQVKSYVVK